MLHYGIYANKNFEVIGVTNVNSKAKTFRRKPNTQLIYTKMQGEKSLKTFTTSQSEHINDNRIEIVRAFA